MSDVLTYAGAAAFDVADVVVVEEMIGAVSSDRGIGRVEGKRGSGPARGGNGEGA
jgi:hypothetical protein